MLRTAMAGPCRVPAGSRVLVAISGGADSVALLVGLHNLAHEFGFELRAAHLHHGLRGADADRDLRFVRALCRRLGAPLETARIDARAEMRRRGLSGQAGLRVLRREFLAGAANRAGAVAIATGHHADDQLETLLMRIARGSGLRGLGGIRPRNGRWLRPLLGAARADVESDLRAIGQPWREDRSNRDLSYLRNRLRHRVIPELVRAAQGPRRDGASIARHAAGIAADMRTVAGFVERASARVLSRALSIEKGEFALDSRVVAPYAPLFRRTVLRRLWTRLALPDPGLTLLHLKALERLMACPSIGARIALPGGWTASSQRETIRFSRPRTFPPSGRSQDPAASRRGARGEPQGR